ncbi:MAG: response regulator [Gammaproteobacteria bacterium]|nr:response regulator [Gammaproteobacteria bacterium]
MEKVLVVDDSKTDLHLLAGYLSNNGYQPITASNGEEAIQKANNEHPDLILMDIVMPGMNGFEATRRLSRNPNTAAIPIVMVSMKNQETDRIWGKRQGARDFLEKPVDEDTLITKIRSL